MTEPSAEQPVRLAGRTLDRTRHICAFFHSREEQNRVLMPFFKEGYDRGEKLFHIVDKRLREDHLACCRDAGIDVPEAERSGQLEVAIWEEAYLKDGYFDAARMIGMVEDVVESSRPRFGQSRLMGNMEWALETLPGVDEFIEYEARLNYVLPRHPDPVICVYDLNKHSGKVVIDILRTHPMVIVGGILQENPLYVPPETFLGELEQRRVAAESSTTLRGN